MVKISSFISIKPNKTLVKKIPTKSYNDYTEEEIIDEKKQNKFSFLMSSIIKFLIKKLVIDT